MHRYLVGYKIVDHINRNTLDNRRSNLRDASASINCHNVEGRTQIGLKGTYWRHKKKKFVCEINNPDILEKEYLGLFLSPIQAARAYDTVAREIYGENATTNFKK